MNLLRPSFCWRALAKAALALRAQFAACKSTGEFRNSPEFRIAKSFATSSWKLPWESFHWEPVHLQQEATRRSLKLLITIIV